MIALAALVGYVIGTIPTAGLIGHAWGVDLRRSGSRNPGANNALRLGGPALAAIVLLAEVSKGLLAVIIGTELASEPGAMVGAIGAVAGNVYNIWYRLEGGKGLGISAGVLAGIWPIVLGPLVLVMAGVAYSTRSSGAATMAAIVTLNCSAVAWWVLEWPQPWGIEPGPILLFGALGISAVLWRRHRPDTTLIAPGRP